jgi:hypothetical protein
MLISLFCLLFPPVIHYEWYWSLMILSQTFLCSATVGKTPSSAGWSLNQRVGFVAALHPFQVV